MHIVNFRRGLVPKHETGAACHSHTHIFKCIIARNLVYRNFPCPISSCCVSRPGLRSRYLCHPRLSQTHHLALRTNSPRSLVRILSSSFGLGTLSFASVIRVVWNCAYRRVSPCLLRYESIRIHSARQHVDLRIRSHAASHPPFIQQGLGATNIVRLTCAS